MPQEYVVRWAGARVGVGASVFHFQSIAGPGGASGIATACSTLFGSLKPFIPDEIQISFDSEVRELTDAGVLMAVYPVSPPTPTAGTATATFANGTGVMVRHSTASIVGGRRLLGRTFIVPAAGVYGNGGDVLPATITSLNTAFATFKTSVAGTGSNFAVWSRANALTADVVTSSCQSRPSVLKTRNDRI